MSFNLPAFWAKWSHQLLAEPYTHTECLLKRSKYYQTVPAQIDSSKWSGTWCMWLIQFVSSMKNILTVNYSWVAAYCVQCGRCTLLLCWLPLVCRWPAAWSSPTERFVRAGSRSLDLSLCPSVDCKQEIQSTGGPGWMRELSCVQIFYWSLCRHVYLSGETIGICVGGIACSLSVGRLVGGLGLSGLLSVLVSVIVSSCLEAALRLSANRSNWNVYFFLSNVTETEICFYKSKCKTLIRVSLPLKWYPFPVFKAALIMFLQQWRE